jgi:adenylyltransferase/sulfurtransferase
LGEEGQRKLLASKVCIIGAGALGSVIANNLCRAGVGFMRIVDRDIVEEVNLQRQILFTEKDAAEGLPKVEAAYNHLREINSEIEIEPITADVNSANVEKIIAGMDLVIDGTDNFETRFLLNEACHKHGIKWVYGGVLTSGGATMNILFGEHPCFRCFMPDMPEPGSYETCSTVGVLNSITGIIGSYEASEAVKILIGADDEISTDYIAVDVWDNSVDFMEVEKDADCPVCVHGIYELLDTPVGSYSTSLCGHNAWQIVPNGEHRLDLVAIGANLEKAGDVKVTKFALGFNNAKVDFKLFPDGRAIINNIEDAAAAKNIYAEYIGI